jgi:hypothetical protein
MKYPIEIKRIVVDFLINADNEALSEVFTATGSCTDIEIIKKTVDQIADFYLELRAQVV